MKLSNIPRKLSAFLITDALLLIAGFAIHADKVTAVCTALVASMAAFVGTHAYADNQQTKDQ